MPDVELGSAPGGSAALHGYLAKPAGEGPWPGVVVIHEAWGLDPMMRRQTDRMAEAGYLTVAPDLFSGGGRLCVAATLLAMVRGQGKAFADLDHTRTWLAGQADCTGKVGAIGFCMGGGFALASAASGWDVAAPNYGLVPRDAEKALAGSCPVVASYGRKDLSMRGMANKLERTLTKLGVEHDVKEYASAGHSFLNDAMTGPRPLRPLLRIGNFKPDPVAAEDAWSRIEAFFAAHLS
jgi:carboxymethylenebutenolidase